MGIFDVFKKKKTEAPAEEAYAPILTEPEKPAPQKPDVRTVLGLVLEKTKGGEWDGDQALRYPAQELSLTMQIGQMNEVNGKYCIQLLFIAKHPYFDEELIESVAGMGDSVEAALQHGAEGFCAGVLTFLLAALDCKGEQTITATLQGKEHMFHEPCMKAVQHMGSTESGADLWALLEDKIPLYLGTKKAYWIKLYAANLDEIICEARINNIIYPELTEMLRIAVAEGRATAKNCTDKMFVLLIQDDKTYTPCPYTKEEVIKYAYRALDLMRTIKDDASHQQVYEQIQQMPPHPHLGGELCTFLPEIFCNALLHYRASDSIQPILAEEAVMVRKSQIRTYGYLQTAVHNYIGINRPSSDACLFILRLSAEFNAVNQALARGSKAEDLLLAPITFRAPEDYVIW